jgi:hypothetical protein
MVSPSFLYDVKKRYGSVFQTSIKKQEIIFRELTFAEYDQIAQHQSDPDFSSADAEELIIKYSIVYPEGFDYNQYPAGLVSSLAEEILEELKALDDESKDILNSILELL